LRKEQIYVCTARHKPASSRNGEITDLGGVKYAGFGDPDGNLWLLQEFPPELRQPGQNFYKEEDK